MCRLFGLHAGREPVSATFWLLDAPDSLCRQSERNPDGFGLVTWEVDGSVDVDKRAVRAMGDDLFAREAREECSTTYLAHVRYASTGAVSDENTHPFVQDGRAFAHNGVLGDLARIEAQLGDARELVLGDTDSERVFALITRSIREHGGEVRGGLVAALEWLAREVELYSVNFVMTTADELWALRYPEHNELYLLDRPAGGARRDRHLDAASAYGTLRMRADEARDRHVVIVASEPMDPDPGWDLLAPGELLHVDPELRVTREIVLPVAPSKPMVLAGVAAASQAQEQ